MLTQHMHYFGCRQFENRHIVKPMSQQQFFCDVCPPLVGILSRHISTSTAHSNKIPTAIPMFAGSNFLMVPLPVSRNVDIARYPRWRSPKWKETSLGSYGYFLCVIMSWPPSWIWSKRE